MLGQAELDDSKTVVDHGCLECIKRVRVGCKSDAKIAAAGSAHFVSHTVAIGLLPDLAVLSCDDLRTNGDP